MIQTGQKRAPHPATSTAVVPRLDRGIQYAAAPLVSRTGSAYWIARSRLRQGYAEAHTGARPAEASAKAASRAMTALYTAPDPGFALSRAPGRRAKNGPSP